MKNSNEDHNVSYRGQVKIVSEEKPKTNEMMIMMAFVEKSGLQREINLKGDAKPLYIDVRIKHGYGVIKTKSGQIYQGFWENNKYHGRGMLTMPNGSVYIGYFNNNMKHGFGILREFNSDKYVGFWKDDLKHGIGHETFYIGIVYQGFYANGLKSGQGIQ